MGGDRMGANNETTIMVSNIQRFSVHDGPGIRTVIFFKGCPLRCIWCQNPETQSTEAEVMQFQEYCIGCKNCIETCPQKAIFIQKGNVKIDRSRCKGCGLCIKKCNAKALKASGKPMYEDDIIQEVLRDRVFYKNTSGGVTLSGGEPMMYPQATTRILKRLKAEGIHTAIETCGYFPTKWVSELKDCCDLLLFDIKHTDPEIHKIYTGKDNALILENLHEVKRFKIPVIIRVPLITGVNDDSENVSRTSEIAKKIGALELHFLPFHQLGENKWHSLDRDYKCKDMVTPKEQTLANCKKIAESYGICVNIGGHGEYI